MYNDGMTGLTSVRMETGNILQEDFPDCEITTNLENAFSKVQLAAGRTLNNPFASTDTEYGLAREIEKKEAAKNSLKAYGGEFRDKITELNDEIVADIQFLKDNMQAAVEDVGGTEILYAVTPYLSSGAILDENPESEREDIIYRSGLTDSVA